MTRTLARLGAAAIVTLALAGCVRVDTDTQIHADDTFSQHAVIAFAPDLMGQLGDLVGDVPAGTPLDDLDPGDLYSQLTSDPDVAAAQEQYPGQIEIEPYDDGELKGIELTLTDLPLSLYEEGVADVAGGLGASGSIEHTDGSFILTVPADPSRDASAAGATAGNLALIEGAVDVSMPSPSPVSSPRPPPARSRAGPSRSDLPTCSTATRSASSQATAPRSTGAPSSCGAALRSQPSWSSAARRS